MFRLKTQFQFTFRILNPFFVTSAKQVHSSETKNQKSTMTENQRQLTRQVISSPKSAPAIGPYSPAILVNGTLYVSGQLGMDSTGDLVKGGVEAEAEQALNNLGTLLNAAGTDYRNVVKTTVLLADMKDFQAVNQIYARFFTKDPPARAAYQVAALPKNARIEIEAVAVLGAIQG